MRSKLLARCGYCRAIPLIIPNPPKAGKHHSRVREKGFTKIIDCKEAPKKTQPLTVPLGEKYHLRGKLLLYLVGNYILNVWLPAFNTGCIIHV